MSLQFSSWCDRCGRFHQKAAALFDTKPCQCGERSSVALCQCGWIGSARKKTASTEYLQLTCPDCGEPIQRLTAERLATVKESSGRHLHEHEPLIAIIMANMGRRIPRHLKEQALDAGRLALINAAITFDPEKAKFTTYATSKIRGYLLHALYRQKREANAMAAYRSEVLQCSARHNGRAVKPTQCYHEEYAHVDD